jgi:hypothetical protein
MPDDSAPWIYVVEDRSGLRYPTVDQSAVRYNVQATSDVRYGVIEDSDVRYGVRLQDDERLIFKQSPDDASGGWSYIGELWSSVQWYWDGFWRG